MWKSILPKVETVHCKSFTEFIWWFHLQNVYLKFRNEYCRYISSLPARQAKRQSVRARLHRKCQGKREEKKYLGVGKSLKELPLYLHFRFFLIMLRHGNLSRRNTKNAGAWGRKLAINLGGSIRYGTEKTEFAQLIFFPDSFPGFHKRFHDLSSVCV